MQKFPKLKAGWCRRCSEEEKPTWNPLNWCYSQPQTPSTLKASSENQFLNPKAQKQKCNC